MLQSQSLFILAERSFKVFYVVLRYSVVTIPLAEYKRRGAAVRFASKYARKHNVPVYILCNKEGRLMIDFKKGSR